MWYSSSGVKRAAGYGQANIVDGTKAGMLDELDVLGVGVDADNVFLLILQPYFLRTITNGSKASG